MKPIFFFSYLIVFSNLFIGCTSQESNNNNVLIDAADTLVVSQIDSEWKKDYLPDIKYFPIVVKDNEGKFVYQVPCRQSFEFFNLTMDENENRIIEISKGEMMESYFVNNSYVNKEGVYKIELEGGKQWYLSQSKGLWNILTASQQLLYTFFDPNTMEGVDVIPCSTLEELFDKDYPFYPLTKTNDKFVIYNECEYGSGNVVIDPQLKELYFTGGGDQESCKLLSVEKFPNVIQLKYFSYMSGDTSELGVQLVGDNLYKFIHKGKNGMADTESYYAHKGTSEDFEEINPPCK